MRTIKLNDGCKFFFYLNIQHFVWSITISKQRSCSGITAAVAALRSKRVIKHLTYILYVLKYICIVAYVCVRVCVCVNYVTHTDDMHALGRYYSFQVVVVAAFIFLYFYFIFLFGISGCRQLKNCEKIN